MDSPVPHGACGVSRSFSTVRSNKIAGRFSVRDCLVIVWVFILSACDGSQPGRFSETLQQSALDGQSEAVQPAFVAEATVMAEPGTAHQTHPSWVRNIDVPESSAHAFQFEILANSRPALFIEQPAISFPDGTLRYTLAADAVGKVQIRFVLRDVHQSTVVSEPHTFSIIVPKSSVNQPPTFEPGPDITALSTDGPVAIPDWVRSVNDGDNNQQMIQFKTVSVSNPDLFNVPPWVSYPSLTLRFEPKPGANGSAKIALQAKDHGGTAGGGNDTSQTHRFQIHIHTPDDFINHAPSFEVGPDISVAGNGTPFAMPDWAKNSDDGDNGTQRMRFKIVSNTRPDLFTDQPWVSYPSHTLRFTPASCHSGTARLGIIVKDNGGTIYGGVDQSGVQYFNITIHCPAPNNSPAFDAGPDIIVPASIGDAEFPGWANNVTDGDGGTQKLKFDIVSNDNAGLFSQLPRVSYPSRTLRFTPFADAEGTAKLGIRLKDDGGTDNGGTDTSKTQTFYITITQPDDPPENNPPSALGIQTSTAFETPAEIVLQGKDPDNDALTYHIVEAPAHGNVEIRGDMALYQPDSAYVGSDSFTYIANDGQASSEPALVEITVAKRKNTKPVAESVEYQIFQGKSLYFELQGVDADNDTLEYHLLSHPYPGHLAGELPYLQYTAPTDFSGKLSFDYQVNDGIEDSEPAIVSMIVIAVNQAPLASDLIYSTDEDVPFEGLLQGSDIENQSLTYWLEKPPEHGTLSGVLPNFTYSPHAGFSGNDAFRYQVFDGQAYSEAAEVRVTVYPVNDTPVAISQTVSTAEDTALDITLQGEDPDRDALSYLVVEKPKNGDITIDNHLVKYTPSDHFFGTDSLSFRVSDGLTFSDPAVVTILVNNTNDRPYAFDQSHTISEDTTLDIRLTGSDPEGSSIGFQIVHHPTSGSLSGTPPQLQYRPDAEFNGTDGFSFTTFDGELRSEPASVSIKVNAENDAPVAIPQSISLDENTSVDIRLTGDDADGDALKIHVLSSPAHGVLVKQQHKWIYRPEHHFSGADQFTFAVSDGFELSDPAAVNLQVQPVNTAPVAMPAHYQLSRNEQLVIALAASDADGDTLNFSIIQSPLNGSLEGSAPNLIYIPNNGYSGSDALTFIARDGSSESAVASVTIEVLPVANRAPIADAGSDRVGLTGTPIELDGSGSSDEDGDSLTYHWSIVETPDNANASLNNQNTANPGFVADAIGPYVVELVVNDGHLNALPDHVSITVHEPGSPPVADAGPDKNGNSDTPLLLDGSGSFATQEGRLLSYAWQIVDQPAGSKAELSNPEARQPQFVADLAGDYRVSLTVNDGVETSTADETVVTLSNGPINTKPLARASFRVDYNEAEDITLYLDGRHSSDVDGDTLSYQWTVSNYHPDYPDRPKLNVINPEWISEPSDQHVKLVVNDGYVDSEPVEFIIPADASFTPSIFFDTTTISRNAGTQVQLSAFVQDHDINNPGLEWTLREKPDSSTTAINDPFLNDTTLLLDSPGKYIVQVSIDDGTPNGQVSLRKIIFATSEDNQQPVANAGDNATIALASPPQRFMLDGTGSYDPEGDPLAYHWALNTPLGSLAKLNDTTLPQPTFSPDVPGEYQLSLWVDDGQALSDEHEIEIKVERHHGNRAPLADAGADFGAETFTEIPLDGSASSDPDGDTMAFFWRVVDQPQGSKARIPSDQSGRSAPVFTPDLPGTYMIHLTVNDFDAVSLPDTLIITVSEKNQLPVADTGQSIGEYNTLDIGQPVTVDGSQSYDPEGNDLTFTWTVLQKPEGSLADVTSVNTESTTFTPDLQGYYQLGLKVNDGLLDSSYGLYSIRAYTTNNQAPVAVVGEPLTGFINTVINLNGSQAYDPDGDELVSRRWQVILGPGGANIQLVAPWDESPWFMGDKPGTYRIGYAVNDGQLQSDIAFQLVTLIGPTPPVANAGDDFASRVKDPAMLEGRNSTDPDGDKLTFSWQILQQPNGSSAYLQDADTAQAKLVSDTLGQYTVQLQVSDGYTSDSDTVVVTLVPNRAPVANAGDHQTVQVGERIQLNGSQSSDPDGDDIAWTWSLIRKPTGSWSQLIDHSIKEPEFIPDKAGDYIAQLIVNDGQLESTPTTVTITAERINAVPTANAGINQTITTGRQVTLDGSRSSDPDGDPLSYSWTILSAPQGSTSTLIAANSAYPDLIPDMEGVYNIQLVVNDGEIDSAPMTVRVTAVSNNTVPEAYASYSRAVITGDAVSVSGWASNDPDGDPLEYIWSIADKPAASTAAFNHSGLLAPVIVVDKPGTYTLELRVSDGLAVSEPHSITITATDGHADLPTDPGNAGKQTLLGIDSDADGVRDDIQRHIWATYPGDGNSNVRKALTAIAKHYEVILWEAMDPDNAYGNAVIMGKHLECLASLSTDSNGDSALILQAEMLDTWDRAAVYQLYDRALEGAIFYSSPVSEWRESCSIDIE